MKVLFFFTSNYPYGTSETFIENEMPFLTQAFDKIILISNNVKNEQTRTVPGNVTLKRFPYALNKVQSILSIIHICNPLFWQELSIIKTIYKKKINFLIVKTLLITLRKSVTLGTYISKLIDENTSSNDQIFAYSYWADDTAFAVTQVKKKLTNIKTFCRAHRWDIYFEENIAGFLPFRLELLTKIDTLFIISNHGKEYIEKLFSKQFENIQIARLGVLKHSISPFSNTDCTIVTISNIVPVKNLKTLVDALSLLDFDFTWYHIGEGYQRKEIEELAQNKIPNKFQFLGQMPNSTVLGFLTQIPVSLFINISLSEGVPVSIMEALSCGIPVIASNVGGNAEIVSNLNGELLSARPSPHEIAQAISSFKNLSESQKKDKRTNAYNTWNEKYNAEKNYSEFIERIDLM